MKLSQAKNNDKIQRVILLQKLHQSLEYWDYDELDLKNLEPLRTEVKTRLQEMLK